MAKGKAVMKLKTQGTGHLTFLNMFFEGEGANNIVRTHICGNLVTADGILTQFFKIQCLRRGDSLKREGKILK